MFFKRKPKLHYDFTYQNSEKINFTPTSCYCYKIPLPQSKVNHDLIKYIILSLCSKNTVMFIKTEIYSPVLII